MTSELDPDRRLILAYVPSRRRAALSALWRLDVTLGAVLATGRDPTIRQIRLAWWREALERLDCAPPPAEPLLRALAETVLPAGVRGAELAQMEEGWALLFTPGRLGAETMMAYAEARGSTLFDLSARLLGDTAAPDGAGARWALIDLARRTSDPQEAADARKLAAAMSDTKEWTKGLRPLAMLDRLVGLDSRSDRKALQIPGSPSRMLRLFGYRLSRY